MEKLFIGPIKCIDINKNGNKNKILLLIARNIGDGHWQQEHPLHPPPHRKEITDPATDFSPPPPPKEEIVPAINFRTCSIKYYNAMDINRYIWCYFLLQNVMTNGIRMFLKRVICHMKSHVHVSLKSTHIDFNVRGRNPKLDTMLQIKHNDLAKFYILIIHISISIPECEIRLHFRK